MKLQSNERGELSTLLPIISLSLLFVAAVIFGVWAFSSRQDYKTNSDAKVSQAVAANTKTVQATDAQQYAEASKSPLKSYVGPAAYGSVQVQYPKTWSAYIDTTDSGTPLNAYFHDDYVPSTGDDKAAYNLRVQVLGTPYDQVLGQYADGIQQGNITAVPYSLPKVSTANGMRLTGKVLDNQDNSGDMVLLPMRDKTLKIWVESPAYVADFNAYILPNLTFSP